MNLFGLLCGLQNRSSGLSFRVHDLMVRLSSLPPCHGPFFLSEKVDITKSMEAAAEEYNLSLTICTSNRSVQLCADSFHIKRESLTCDTCSMFLRQCCEVHGHNLAQPVIVSSPCFLRPPPPSLGTFEILVASRFHNTVNLKGTKRGEHDSKLLVHHLSETEHNASAVTVPAVTNGCPFSL